MSVSTVTVLTSIKSFHIGPSEQATKFEIRVDISP